MSSYRTLIVGGALCGSLLLAPVLAEAQGFREGFTQVEQERREQGIRDFGSFSNFVIAVLRVVAAIVAVLAVGALIYGAVMYIVSMGDEGRAETAKKIILYALVGLLVLGVAGILVNVVINLIRR